MAEISTMTWTPKAVNVADSIVLAVLPRGLLIEQAWLWIEQTSDNGSSGQIGLSGDTGSLFALGSVVSGDVFSDALGRTLFFLNSSHPQVVTAAETISLTWTPGGSPGATVPRFTVKLVTEQLF
jgi:hypothetical protein